VWFQSCGLTEACLLMFVSGMSQYTNPYAVLLNKIEHHYCLSSWVIRRSRIVAILSIHFRAVHSQFEFVLSLRFLSEELTMKSTVFWYGTLYSMAEVHWRFRRMYCLGFQWRISQTRNSKMRAASRAACCLLLSGFLRGLVFSPEDRRCIFPWNNGKFLQDYMVLCPRRQYSSCVCQQGLLL
jgi:hypothetical protein